jgi:hypothetical protein
MSRRAGILTVIIAGSLWGLSEIFLGDVFYMFHIPMRAAALTAVGLAVLVTSRMLYDRPGTSIAAGLLAGALRCLVPKLYICHFVAIGLEAAAFDMSWTVLRAGQKNSVKRAWLASAMGAYTGFLAFGLVGAYGFGFGRWVEAGVVGILRWTLRSGTVSSLILLGLAPLGVYAARRLVRSVRAPSPTRRSSS